MIKIKNRIIIKNEKCNVGKKNWMLVIMEKLFFPLILEKKPGKRKKDNDDILPVHC